jgi:large subunit ribosomal protein L23
MIRIEDVLVKPVQTEKSVGMETGSKYTFVVHANASKTDVVKAVKEFYGADVVSVNIIKLPKKIRIIGRGKEMTKRRPTKKAIVTLPTGKTLDFNAIK